MAAMLGGSFVVGVVPSQSAPPPPPAYVAHEVIVGFKAGTSETTRADVHARHGGKVLRRFDSITADLVSVGNYDAIAKRDEYKTESSVRTDSLNYIHEPVAAPNDPLFGSMWNLNNTGQSGGVANADINAPEAWELSTVAPSVIVADIDTGIDTDSPDLAGNIWTNPSPGAACVGSPPYPAPCSDLHGWDTANEDPTVFDPLQRTGDDFGDRHGTHTAGTIGAVGGNGIGVTGVAQGVRIMPVKFLNFGFGNDGDAIQSIDYARTHGAKVINASWGGGAFNQLVKDAIDRAGADGIIFVAAAGNSTRNTDTSPFYPADYTSTNIISVAATNDRDQLASFSNWGPTTVDLAAPGDVVLSTAPRAPAGVVWNGKLVYLAFGVEGLSSSASRQDVIQRSLGYLSASGRVLVVDDDEGKTYETYYTGALTALGVAFDVVTVPVGGVGPTTAQMAGYAATIWLTGDAASQTFLAQDQTAVTNLLAGGGKLLVTGQNIGDDLDINNKARTWYRATLRAQAVSNNSLKTDLTGEAGGPFAGLTASIIGGDGANNQASPGKVWPLNGSVSTLGYPPYATMSGTSMATPHVTGAVALLRGLKPNATVAELKSWIFSSVDQLPSLAGKVATGGRLNLRRAMELAIGDATPPTVGASTLTGPNGGEAIAGGAAQQITWNAASITDPYLASAPIRLESSSDAGATWSLIADSLPNSGSYSWSVPGIDSTNALVKLTATDKLGNAASDTSNAAFLIDSTAPSFGTASSTPATFSSASSTSSLALEVAETNPDSWTLTIRNAAGIAVRTATGAGSFASFAWNGRNDSGAIVADGTYSWTVDQRDRVGHTSTSPAGSVGIDSSAPSLGTPTSTPAVFSPAGGGTSSFAVTVTETDPDTWTLTVRNGAGAVVRTATGSGAFASYIWNGKDTGGAIVPDGTYTWTVDQSDLFGNSATSAPGSVAVDSSAPSFGTPTSTPAVFSPAGGGTANLAVAVTESDPDSWTLSIRNGEGTVVRTATGSGAFTSFAWNGHNDAGAITPDGTYTWTVEQSDHATNTATSTAGSVGVDSSAPSFGTPTSTPATFSPATGATSSLAVAVTEPDPDSWTLSIRNGAGTIVRTATGSGAFASYSWNGKDTGGAIVPDGTYTWTVDQSDHAGNTASSTAGSVSVDAGGPSFGTPTSTPATFSPATGATSSLAVAVTEPDPDSWTLSIRNGAGTIVRTAAGSGAFASYSWNGKDTGGAIVPDGTYTWTVNQSDHAGNAATSPARNVAIDSTAPAPTGLAATPFSFDPAAGGTTSVGFSIAEPATVDVVTLNVGGTVVRRLAQAAPLAAGAQTFAWNGRDDAGNLLPVARYQVRVTATDAAGNVATATAAAEIIATDAVRQGVWVGAFGSRGYILPAWVKGSGSKPPKDTASLPTSVQSYTVNSGTGLIWASKTSDIRALTNPDGTKGNATAYSSPTQVKVTVNWKAADRAVLSLYLLDWDSTARRETITITDADGSRTYPITASFQGGLWLRVPVSGTTQIPVVITVTKTAGTSAVLSGIMFD